MKVLIGECRQEVSTFNPAVTGYDDFVTAHGQDVLDFHRNLRTEIGGAMSVLGTANIELVGAFSSRSITSGGPLQGDAWDRLSREFLDAVREVGPVDGIFFAMHGAMSATNEIDPEGFLLQETRKIVGEAIPIVVSLDLHGIFTDRMLTHATAAVPYHTYPHNDFLETGQRAGKLLQRLLKKEVNPVTAVVRVPALVRGDELITATGKIGRQIKQAQRIEATPGGLSAGMFWGNPFTDVPELCSHSYVVTDGDPEWASREAIRMAEEFWAERAAMQSPLVSPAKAIKIAEATSGTTVLIDAADATSSGASGDSNAILKALIESGYSGRALLPIVDAPAVQDAMRAGVGASIRTTLGGTLDPGRFTPLAVEATVRMLSDGRFINESHNTEWYAGDTAVLEIGRHIVIATSRAVSLYDRSLFHAHGQDPKRFECVIQKSPHCQYHMFAEWATLVGVDAPGSTSANLAYLGHTECRRPMYPMELDTEFNPEVTLFQR